MTRTEARAALRATTPVTFYKMGQRGIVLFALLLITATQPTQAFLNHAAAFGGVPPKSQEKAKYWYEAFKGQEVSTATQFARTATATAVAYSTGSGTATTALIVSQMTATAYGQFILTLVVVTFLITQVLSYGKARFNRQTAKNQMALMKNQMEQQRFLIQMLIDSKTHSPSTNRLVRPALTAS